MFGWGPRLQVTKTELAEILEDAVRGENISNFNQFANSRIEDLELEAIRQQILTIPNRHPEEGYWCSQSGFEEMIHIARELRQRDD